MPMAFFVVNVKGRDNVLLGQDWIHANGCVPSTLHQCVIQWISDEVDAVQADEDVCNTVAESQDNIQEGYDYVSIGKDGFVSISVKLVISATWLAHDLV
jgi:hypothetical protein